MAQPRLLLIHFSVSCQNVQIICLNTLNKIVYEIGNKINSLLYLLTRYLQFILCETSRKHQTWIKVCHWLHTVSHVPLIILYCLRQITIFKFCLLHNLERFRLTRFDEEESKFRSLKYFQTTSAQQLIDQIFTIDLNIGRFYFVPYSILNTKRFN